MADRVSERPCSGRLAPAGQPRHPRPAGVGLAISPVYAAEYGVRDLDGHLVEMDVAPILDLTAARYDACSACADQHTSIIAADAALTTHLIGMALRAISNLSEAPATLVLQHLDPPGAAIALTMRTRGLLAAVQTAGALPSETRRNAVAIAASLLLPVSWYAHTVGHFYEHGGHGGVDDSVVLDALRSDGYLPA